MLIHDISSSGGNVIMGDLAWRVEGGGSVWYMGTKLVTIIV